MPVTPAYQADARSCLAAMVRDRRSTKASTKSVNDIPNSFAARSIVSNLGCALLLNQIDQLRISTPVFSLKSLYDRFKNSSLLTLSYTDIDIIFTAKSIRVIYLNNGLEIISKITQYLDVLVNSLTPKSIKTSLKVSPPGNDRLGECRLHPCNLPIHKRQQNEYTTTELAVSRGENLLHLCRHGGVAMESSIANIPPGREGWVYLIGALGTNRYKIGRSVNPIRRVAEIQGQSPYPLEIYSRFWTVDAIADEAELHRIFNPYRVFGEWFEFSHMVDEQTGISLIDKVEARFRNSPTISLICRNSLVKLYAPLRLNHEYKDPFYDEALALYSSLRNYDSVLATEKFLTEILPNLVADAQISLCYYGGSSSARTLGTVLTHFLEGTPGTAEEQMQLLTFMHGSLRSFAFTHLRRKGARLGITGRRGWEVT